MPPARIGPLRVLGRAGAGCVGEVWRVRHEDGRHFALKILMNPGPYAEARFAREVEALRQVRHPNVIAIVGTTRVEGRPALLLEWVEGATLEQAVPPSPAARLALFEGVLRGVAAAHLVGVVHRDLKPANVMVEAGRARVGDFGLAKLLDAGVALTRSGAALGTLGWMSPEASTQAGRVDARTDLYSLGCLLYWLLSGEMAWPSLSRSQLLQDQLAERHRPLEELVPGLAPGPAAAVRACLRADPDARPPTCAALWRLVQGGA